MEEKNSLESLVATPPIATPLVTFPPVAIPPVAITPVSLIPEAIPPGMCSTVMNPLLGYLLTKATTK